MLKAFQNQDRWWFFGNTFEDRDAFSQSRVIFEARPLLSKITFKSSTPSLFTNQYQTRLFTFYQRSRQLFSRTFSFSCSIFGFFTFAKIFLSRLAGPLSLFFANPFKTPTPLSKAQDKDFAELTVHQRSW